MRFFLLRIKLIDEERCVLWETMEGLKTIWGEVVDAKETWLL